MHRPLLLLAALVATPTTARAECAAAGLVPVVLNNAAFDLPASGGFVVAAESKAGAALGTGDVAVQPRWRLSVGGGGFVAPRIDKVAPGLAIYRIAPAHTGAIGLLDGAGAEVATIQATRALRPTLAAPAVKRVYRADVRSRRGITRVAVELDAVPATALALVLADAKGVARSWGTARGAGGTTLYPLYSPGCAALPNGTQGTEPGDSVTVFWVDEFGRESPRSKPFTVGATP